MPDNAVLRAIRERRSVRNFSADPVDDGHIAQILEAARWAPSGLNSQPWDLVVVKDAGIRSELGSALKRVTFSWAGMAAAPVMIVVSVDATLDPDHFVEDGAVAAQNLCVAAQSLGLSSSWAGVFAPRGSRNSVERAVADIVGLPATHRVIAVVPIGHGRLSKTAERRPLNEMVHLDRYSNQPESQSPFPSDQAEEDGSEDSRPALAEPRHFW